MTLKGMKKHVRRAGAEGHAGRRASFEVASALSDAGGTMTSLCHLGSFRYHAIAPRAALEPLALCQSVPVWSPGPQDDLKTHLAHDARGGLA
jgi:hypothetical protein